ncbi:hypothetical protein CDD82_382 [Ophiocordyceps australis]|uniref:DM2 domain-containing protein n=1 Tax=Ophiocordyceps australis TaxID=1399860 RepID=A0A2C5ZQJ0_9HYPO|nr:hypothetical protein CDD82_382 [Ophiocordyceps australis]
MQPRYRAYAQQAPPQRSPHAPNQRRGGIGPMIAAGPHPAAPLSQAQLAQQQQAQIQANDMAKRRSRKPTDKNMPDGVEECIVDPQAVQQYKQLRDSERLLDAAITRKRLDICERINRRHAKLPKTLRIWISNTVEDQIWQGNGLNVDAFDFTPNMEASYRATIQGRLIDEDDEHVPLGQSSSSAPGSAGQDDPNKTNDSPSEDSKPRFSTFFRSLTVEFDRSRFRNGAEQCIEWSRPDPNAQRGHPLGAPAAGSQPPVSEFDELTFKRHGDENTNITINLFRHEFPERYRVNPILADVIDMTEATHQEAVTALWEYIRFWGLQEDEEKRNFRCDELLKKVLRDLDVGHMPMLGAYVEPLLEPLPPISLSYTIRVDEEFHKDPRPTVYDVRVFVDDPSHAELQPLVNSMSFGNMFKQVTELDDQLARIIQAIGTSKAKHSFFSSLGSDPATFVRNWMSSQKRDLEIITGESIRGIGDDSDQSSWRKCGPNSVWASQTARESVNVLLTRR